MLISAVALLLSADAAVASVPEAIEEPNPKAMSSTEIRAFNAKLPKGHPYYIRCVRVAETGSLVARRSSCRTNQQWAAAEEAGNRNARETADAMVSKSWNQAN